MFPPRYHEIHVDRDLSDRAKKPTVNLKLSYERREIRCGVRLAGHDGTQSLAHLSWLYELWRACPRQSDVDPRQERGRAVFPSGARRGYQLLRYRQRVLGWQQ